MRARSETGSGAGRAVGTCSEVPGSMDGGLHSGVVRSFLCVTSALYISFCMMLLQLQKKIFTADKTGEDSEVGLSKSLTESAPSTPRSFYFYSAGRTKR